MRAIRPFSVMVAAMLCLAAAVPTFAQGRRAAPAQPAAAPLPYVPPRGAWERKPPAELGFDAAKLAEAVTYAQQHESTTPRDLAVAHYLQWGREPYDAPIGPLKERGPATGLVIHKGYIVAEWGEPTRVDMTFSVTKSFVSTVVGLAFDTQLLRDVHEPVSVTVPIAEFASAHNRTITWDHLLRQTSDWEGTLWGKPDWADRPQGEPSTWMTRPRNAPGTVYKYNDVRVNALALAALHVWRRPLPQVLRERVMDPIGASRSWQWHAYDSAWVNIDGVMMQAVGGGGHWGGGMFIDAEDMARFGLLTLRGGAWGGRQLLSEQWIRQARTPGTANPQYGYMNYFLNTGRKALPSAPAEAWYHLGNGTNMVYCDPVNDLVIVARWIDTPGMDGLVQRILAARQ